MDKILKIIDDIFNKIPPHILDIIQKAGYALAAFLMLMAIVFGITMGIKDAKPGGVNIISKTRDLIYLEELRHKNAESIKLIEDISIPELHDQIDVPNDDVWKKMGKDTSKNLMGETEQLILPQNESRDKVPRSDFLVEEQLKPERVIEEEKGELIDPSEVTEAKKEVNQDKAKKNKKGSEEWNFLE